MNRRLGPEETKYWLLSRTRPFNIVLALGVADWRPPVDLAGLVPALPVPLVGPDGQPRWAKAGGPGHISRLRGSWVRAAEAELAEPLGDAGAPPWRLVVVEDDSGTVLLLTLPHALADARGGLNILAGMIEGRPAAPLPPSFEELLPLDAYPDPGVAEEVLDWWSRRLSARVQALDLTGLADLLPRARSTRLAAVALGKHEFERLIARCREERTTLHGPIVAALTACASVGSQEVADVGHAVDMRRYLSEPFASQAWFAMSHVRTALPEGGTFWERARHAHQSVGQALAAGSAGAALVELPRTLGAATTRIASPPPLTVSNTGRLRLPQGPHGRGTWFMALAGSNAGAPVLAVGGSGEELILASATPDDHVPLPLEQIADRLNEAASA